MLSGLVALTLSAGPASAHALSLPQGAGAGATVELRGRIVCLDEKTAADELETSKVYSVRDGRLHDLDYFCTREGRQPRCTTRMPRTDTRREGSTAGRS